MPRKPTASTLRTGPSRRTQEQRDVINRRAAAWKRPKRKRAVARKGW